MTTYRLTEAAEADIDAIFDYSERKWGVVQAHRYVSQLHECAEAIAKGSVRSVREVDGYPGLLKLHCQHHYVFAVNLIGEPVSIVAILHEKMNLMARIAERLE